MTALDDAPMKIELPDGDGCAEHFEVASCPKKTQLLEDEAPKKVRLPTATMSTCWPGSPGECQEPLLLGSSPRSPPPLLPPMLPVSHQPGPEPPIPPPSKPAFLLAASVMGEQVAAVQGAVRMPWPSEPPPLDAAATMPMPPPFAPSVTLNPAPLPAAPVLPAAPPLFPPAVLSAPGRWLKETQQFPNRPAQLDCISLVTNAVATVPPPIHTAPISPMPLNHGSMLHGTGSCRPCAWFWKAVGCQNAQRCGHCHLCPSGEIKSRKKARRGATARTPVGGMAGLAINEPREQEPEASTPSGTGGSELESTTGSGSEDWTDSDTAEAVDAVSSARRKKTLESLEPPPGLQHPPTDGLPSVGSVLHVMGGCRPCAWYWKPVGCNTKANCGFCHMCPQGAAKTRKKMAKHAVTSPLNSVAMQTSGRLD